MRLDHVVLWVQDPAVAMDFYTRVVGLQPVRFDEFLTGDAPFPSVRVSDDPSSTCPRVAKPRAPRPRPMSRAAPATPSTMCAWR